MNLQAQLAEPFDPAEIKFKPQMVKDNRALAMPYIDARLVQDRLDEAVGVGGWHDDYSVLDRGDVVCRLSVKIDGEWLTKCDVGSPSEQPDDGDKLKAAFSDALKRAAIKFGIGRYLYRLKAQWVGYDPVKKQLTERPTLPPFAIPTSHQPCGVAFATRLDGLMRQLAEATKTAASKVAADALATHKLPTNTRLSEVPNAKAKDILQTLNEALAIAARNTKPEPSKSEPKPTGATTQTKELTKT